MNKALGSAFLTVGLALILPGFVLDQLGFIPKGGESFEFGTSRFTVAEMDGKRVARVKIQRIRPAEEVSKPAGLPTAIDQRAKEKETKIAHTDS